MYSRTCFELNLKKEKNIYIGDFPKPHITQMANYTSTYKKKYIYIYKFQFFSGLNTKKKEY